MSLDSLGLQKTTLVDYPGRVACTLFTAGCNLACPYCHNPELLRGKPPASFLPLSTILEFLAKRRKLISGVCVSGGEPLLHRDLPRLIERIHSMGFSVKVDTNGLLPGRIAALRADYIAMDLKTAPARYPALGGDSGSAEAIRDSMRIIRSLGIPYEFRTTMAPRIVDQAALAEIQSLLDPADRWVQNRFRPGRNLDPAFGSELSA